VTAPRAHCRSSAPRTGSPANKSPATASRPVRKTLTPKETRKSAALTRDDVDPLPYRPCKQEWATTT
jgi:hypothetical protein